MYFERPASARFQSSGSGKLVRLHAVVVVIADINLILLSVLVDARRNVNVRGSRDPRNAHGLRHEKTLLDLLIGELVAKAVVEGVQIDARVIELFANPANLVHGWIGAPGGDLRTILWQDLVVPQLGVTESDFLHGGDASVECWKSAKAVGLSADHDSIELGIDAGNSGNGNGARGKLHEIPASDHDADHINQAAARESATAEAICLP